MTDTKLSADERTAGLEQRLFDLGVKLAAERRNSAGLADALDAAHRRLNELAGQVKRANEATAAAGELQEEGGHLREELRREIELGYKIRQEASALRLQAEALTRRNEVLTRDNARQKDALDHNVRDAITWRQRAERAEAALRDRDHRHRAVVQILRTMGTCSEGALDRLAGEAQAIENLETQEHYEREGAAGALADDWEAEHGAF